MSKIIAKDCCAPVKAPLDLRPIEGDEADQDLAFLAKAVGHPIRVKILRILARQETCVCGDIVDELPLAQSTVSQHLRVLKEVGLIQGTIEGTSTCYCVDPAGLRRLKVLIAGL